MVKLLKLEDRVVLDGAAVDVAQSMYSEVMEKVVDALSQAQQATFAAHPMAQIADSLSHTALAPMDEKVAAITDIASQTLGEQVVSVTLVSSDLPNVEVLSAVASAQHRVIVFDANAPDAQAVILAKVVDDIKEAGSTLGAVNIMSHGGGGYFQMGTEVITADNLDADAWGGLSTVLSENSRINIYGCGVVDGSGAGQSLLDQIAERTGASVFGSDDVTGLGGDWELEVASDGAVLVPDITPEVMLTALNDWNVSLPGPTALDSTVWLRADTGVFTETSGTIGASNGSGVALWQDQSGNNHHVQIGNSVGSGDPTYTTGAIGGQAAVTFDGNDQLEFVDSNGNASPLVLPNTGWTIFLVWETTNATNAVVQYALGGNDQGLLLAGSAFTTKWGLIGDDPGDNNLVGDAPTTGQDTYATFYQHSIYDEGSLETNYNTKAGDSNGALTVDSVGSRADFPNFGHVGHIAELIIYDTELNAGERQLVEDYINTRYGFNSSANSYTLDTSASINTDVTAVGRDAASFNDFDTPTHTGLDNPSDAHTSTSAGFTLTASADDTAAGASATELDIGEEIFFGHDNASQGQTVASGSIKTAGIDAYYSRSWGVQKGSGTVADVTLTFDLTDASGTTVASAGTASNYALLYRADSSVDWTLANLANSAASTNGDQVTFTVAGGELSDGLYTLGSRDLANSSLGDFNADPAFANLSNDSRTYTEGTDSTAVVIDQSTAATITDSDSADFNGGSLSIAISSGGVNAQDVLGIRDQGTGGSNITVDTVGQTVSYGGNQIGTYTGGTNGSPLVITFNSANADPTAVSALVQNITYFNSSGDGIIGGTRTIQFTVADGDGGSAGPVSTTITVVGINDAPTQTGNTNTTTYQENNTSGVGLVANAADYTLSLVESDQTVEELRFQITNIQDNTNEYLVFDATDIALNTATNQTTNGNNYNYSVVLTDGGATATVTLTLTGQTVANTESRIEAAKYRYDGENIQAGSGARSVSVQAVDSGGTANSGANTSAFFVLAQVTVEPLNDDPTVTGAPSDVSFAEDVQGNVDLSSITLADVDSGTGTFTLTITADAGTLAASSTANVTAALSNSNRTVTLTGTVANIDTYLNTASNIQYTGAQNVNGGDVATLTIVGNDGGGSGTGGGTDLTLATINVDISAVNDAPVVSTSSSYAFGTGPTLNLEGTMSIADVDAGNVNNITATLSVDEGTITITTSNTITLGTNGTASVTLTGTLAQVNAVLNGTNSTTIVYTNNSPTPPNADLTLSVTDLGNTGTGNVLTDTTTVNINFNSAADVDLNGSGTGGNDSAVSYTENDANTPVAIAPNATVDDPENDALTSITLSLSNFSDKASGVEVITIGGTAFTISGDSGSNTTGDLNLSIGSTGYTGVYDQSADTITIDLTGGTQTDAAVQSLLQGITYHHTAQDPTAGARTIGIQINDGNSNSTSHDAVVTVSAVNDDPTNSGTALPSSASFTEDIQGNLDLSNITLADVDVGSAGTLTVTLTRSGGGALASSGGTGITVGGTSSALTLTGTLANLNTFLANTSAVQYTGAQDVNGNGADSVAVTVTDNGNTGGGGGGTVNLGTVSINISSVNDAPTLTGSLTGDPQFTEDTQGNLDLSALTLADVDAGSNTFTLTLTATEGTLSANSTNAANNSVTPVVSNGGTTLTLTGTVANIEAFLSQSNSIQYQGAQDDNGAPAATLNIVGNDGQGSGNVDLTPTDINLDITAVPDVPVVDLGGSNSGNSVTYTETDGSNTVSVIPSATVSDVENSDLTTVVLSLSNFLNKSDGTETLSINGVPVTINNTTSNPAFGGVVANATYDKDANTLTLNLNAGTKAADVQTLLRTLTYQNNTEAPADGNRTIGIVVNDAGGGSVSRDAVINVDPVNDVPTDNGSLPSDRTFVEDTTGNLDLSTIDIADVDIGNGNMTVTLTASGGTLTAVSSGNVTVAGSGSGTLVLTGTVNDLNTFLDSASNVQYKGVQDAAGDNVATVSVQANDGTGNVNLGSVNVDITAQNDTPVATGTTGVDITEGGTITSSSSLLLVTDVDSPAASLTYTVTQAVSLGELKLNGVLLGLGDTFTQEDVNAGRITYVAPSNGPVTDVAKYTVSDGAGGNLAEQSFSFNVKDAPTLVSTAAVTVDSGQTVGLGATQLQAQDQDSNPAQITYRITQSPTTGNVLLNGTPLGLNGTFTQADVNAGRVSYQSSTGSSGAGEFRFSVSDETGGTTSEQVFRVSVNAETSTQDSDISPGVVNAIDDSGSDDSGSDDSGSGDSVSGDQSDDAGGDTELTTITSTGGDQSGGALLGLGNDGPGLPGLGRNGLAGGVELGSLGDLGGVDGELGGNGSDGGALGGNQGLDIDTAAGGQQQAPVLDPGEVDRGIQRFANATNEDAALAEATPDLLGSGVGGPPGEGANLGGAFVGVPEGGQLQGDTGGGEVFIESPAVLFGAQARELVSLLEGSSNDGGFAPGTGQNGGLDGDGSSVEGAPIGDGDGDTGPIFVDNGVGEFGAGANELSGQLGSGIGDADGGPNADTPFNPDLEEELDNQGNPVDGIPVDDGAGSGDGDESGESGDGGTPPNEPNTPSSQISA